MPGAAGDAPAPFAVCSTGNGLKSTSRGARTPLGRCSGSGAARTHTPLGRLSLAAHAPLRRQSRAAVAPISHSSGLAWETLGRLPRKSSAVGDAATMLGTRGYGAGGGAERRCRTQDAWPGRPPGRRYSRSMWAVSIRTPTYSDSRLPCRYGSNMRNMRADGGCETQPCISWHLHPCTPCGALHQHTRTTNRPARCLTPNSASLFGPIWEVGSKPHEAPMRRTNSLNQRN